jgi:long-chain fatty acid transport protein
MRRSLVMAAAVYAALCACAPSRAMAQGSGVMTHGSCATALGAAGVAHPCDDGSGILFSPAGLVQHAGVVSGGVTGITTSGSFTYDFEGQRIDRESSTKLVPWGFATHHLRPKLAVGIGAFAPYGLGVEWPLNFEGRFTSYDTDLKNIYVQPTIAYQVHPRLSLGVGLDYVRSSLTIHQRADLAFAPTTTPGVTFGNLGVPVGTDFADAELAGTGHGITFNAGAVLKLTERAELGMRYLHRTRVDLSGKASFSRILTGVVLPGGNPISQPGNPYGFPAGSPVPVDSLLGGQFASGGALAGQGLSTSLTLPYQLVVGLAVKPVDALRLVADYQRTGWQAFDSARIDFAGAGPDQTLILDYQNTSTYRFGADFSATPALNLRAGFIFNTAAERAASVSPLLPEAERNYLTAGVGYRAGPLALDVGYQHIHQADRRGRTRSRTSFAQTPQQLNVGVYHVKAHVLNATLAYHFGGRR